MTIGLQELEKRLGDAANALRGPVDPADFKTYVFPMLFWKWISDTWDWEHAQAVAEMGEDLTDEVEADYHRFNLPDGTHWRLVTTKTSNLGSRVGTALAQIQQANPESLAGIFGDAAWGNKERLPEASLINLIQAFDGITLNPDSVSNDVLGQAYEYLLKNFADESGKKAGEFFTPRSVVSLLVHLLSPKAGESVYDPACGSGGMLVETINTVRRQGGDTRTLRLYGQEVNLTTSAIARMNLFLHDIEDFKIVRGDTLRSPSLRDEDGRLSKFDVVVANPPFVLKNWGADAWLGDVRAAFGLPPEQNADYAWIQHMIASAAPAHGRIGVVMLHGVLFRGDVEHQIRKSLLESGWLHGVVGLPPNLFYSTTVRACLLVLRAPLGEKPGPVRLVDASREFVKARGANNEMTDHNVLNVLEAFESGRDVATVRVRDVSLADIQEQRWSLSLGKYIPGAGKEIQGLDEASGELQQAWASLSSLMSPGGGVQ